MGIKIELNSAGDMFRYIETPPVERINKGNNIISNPANYIVIDIETTGLDLEYCSIIEIAAIKVRNRKIVDTFNLLVKPIKWYYLDNDNYEEEDFFPFSEVTGCYYVNDFITKLTGITNEMLESAPQLKDVLKKFRSFIGTDTLIGHNVNFDINFLYIAFENELKESLTNDFIDTMRFSRKVFKKNQHHRLRDTATACEIEYKNAHRALNDCNITYACYEKMLDIISNNYNTFSDFEKIFNYGKTINCSGITTITEEFNEEHPLFKKSVVFTGALEMPRKEAMQHVVNVGGLISNSVTMATNYLVIGSFNYIKSVKDGKSSKIKKAEKMKLDGFDINIIYENTFIELLENK